MSALDEIGRLSAASIGRLLQAGDLNAEALTEACLQRIADDGDSHVFITVLAERARREAKAAAVRLAAGRPASPLDGVPLAWKDLVDLEGEVTTSGSDLYRNAAPAKADAPIAQNLTAAGMVALGKVNLSEFAYSGLGINIHFGTPANPHDATTPRVPGGSSSGSAVAVAKGLAPAAIGTDTGGSVRIPSSYCGLVGYKSSEGRINKSHVFPLSDSLDSIGPMARSVEDCILMDRALRGEVCAPVERGSLAGQRVLVPQTVVFDDADDAVVAAFEETLSRLSRAGAKIERAACPPLTTMGEITVKHGTLTAAEAYYVHREAMEGPDRARIDQRITSRVARAETMSAVDYVTIVEARKSLRRTLLAQMDGAILAYPTTAITAPKIAPLEADEDAYHAANLMSLRNTMIGNFLNLCGLALPNGRDAKGLPTSALFSLPGGDDERLFSVGLAIEDAMAGLYQA